MSLLRFMTLNFFVFHSKNASGNWNRFLPELNYRQSALSHRKNIDKIQNLFKKKTEDLFSAPFCWYKLVNMACHKDIYTILPSKTQLLKKAHTYTKSCLNPEHAISVNINCECRGAIILVARSRLIPWLNDYSGSHGMP